MGNIYDRFRKLEKEAGEEWFLDELGLVTFEDDGKNYEIYFTRRKANKHSIIHCVDNTVEWEQVPTLSTVISKMHSKKYHIINIFPSSSCIKIIAIMGKPGSIFGLDAGVFRSVYKLDENYINVATEEQFKWI